MNTAKLAITIFGIVFLGACKNECLDLYESGYTGKLTFLGEGNGRRGYWTFRFDGEGQCMEIKVPRFIERTDFGWDCFDYKGSNRCYQFIRGSKNLYYGDLDIVGDGIPQVEDIVKFDRTKCVLEINDSVFVAAICKSSK